MTVETLDQVEGYKTRVFDFPILPPGNLLSSIVSLFWNRMNEKLKNISYRRFISLQIYLPYFSGISDIQR